MDKALFRCRRTGHADRTAGTRAHARNESRADTAGPLGISPRLARLADTAAQQKEKRRRGCAVRLLIVSLLILIGAVGLALFAYADTGHIVIAYGDWTVEASLALAVAALSRRRRGRRGTGLARASRQLSARGPHPGPEDRGGGGPRAGALLHRTPRPRRCLHAARPSLRDLAHTPRGAEAAHGGDDRARRLGTTAGPGTRAATARSDHRQQGGRTAGDGLSRLVRGGRPAQERRRLARLMGARPAPRQTQ